MYCAYFYRGASVNCLFVASGSDCGVQARRERSQPCVLVNVLDGHRRVACEAGAESTHAAMIAVVTRGLNSVGPALTKAPSAASFRTRKTSGITDMNNVKHIRRPFFTIGHSTRSVDEVAEMLHQVGAETIVDVRKMPRSRTNPQFNIDALPGQLRERQIGYRHIPALGGLRGRQAAAGSSPNTFWQNKSFRNYADYAMTPPFHVGLVELIELGRQQTCAVMCSEALWWRCHRRIIADYLLSEGAAVFHVLGPSNVQRATLTKYAKIVPTGLLYAALDSGA